jgi:hypothetical protein
MHGDQPQLIVIRYISTDHCRREVLLCALDIRVSSGEKSHSPIFTGQNPRTNKQSLRD